MVDQRDRLRFEVPLYTVTDAARIVDVPVSTLSTWAQGYTRHFPDRPDVVGDPIVTYVRPEGPRRPSIPFVGLTEATVLAAIRRSGVPMQRIRPALRALEARMGIDHALASQRLYTDGAELLYDYAASHPDTATAGPPCIWSSSEAGSGSSPRSSRSTSVASSTPPTGMPN